MQQYDIIKLLGNICKSLIWNHICLCDPSGNKINTSSRSQRFNKRKDVIQMTFVITILKSILIQLHSFVQKVTTHTHTAVYH